MTSTVKPDVPEVLPRGPHKLPESVVRASQRERLLRAMLESVGERGYEPTTVPHVVAKARVGRNAFYALFNDKTDCFLALCDQLAEELLSELLNTGATDWIDALRSGTRRYIRWWQDDPAMARAYLVELPSAGSRAAEHRLRIHARYVELYDQLAAWARGQQPDLPSLRPTTTRLIVLGVENLVAQEVQAGRVAKLAELEDDLVYFSARMLADDAVAQRALG